MIPLDSVKLLVQQRLHVAAEEIFDLLERFITEYKHHEDTHWRLHTEPQHEDTHWRLHTEPQHEDTHWRLHTEPQQQHHHHHTLIQDQCVVSSLQVKMVSPVSPECQAGRTQRQRRLPQHFQDFELASMKAVDGATDQPHKDLDPLSPPAQSALTSVSINSSSDQCVESRLQVRMNSPDPATGFSVKKEEPEDHPHFILVKEEVEDPERCEGDATDHGCRSPPSASTRPIDGATDQPHEDLAPLSPPAQSALTSVSNNSSSESDSEEEAEEEEEEEEEKKERRHGEINESDLEELERSRYEAGTFKQTKWSVRCFQTWCAEKELAIDFKTVTEVVLNQTLRQFYASVKNGKGKPYGFSSYVGLRAGLNRHLNDPPVSRSMCLLKDPQFITSNIIFLAVVKRLRREGLRKSPPRGNTFHHRPLTEVDFRKITRSRALSPDTPEGLVNKVWFDVQLHMGRRGKEGNRHLKAESFSVHRDDATGGRKYATLALSEYPKTHRDAGETDNRHCLPGFMCEQPGNPLCPVASLEKYLSLLPADPPAFYLHPIRKNTAIPITKDLWYTREPMGINFLASMLPRICKAAGTQTIYTNTCLQKTSLVQADAFSLVQNPSDYQNPSDAFSLVQNPSDAFSLVQNPSLSLEARETMPVPTGHTCESTPSHCSHPNQPKDGTRWRNILPNTPLKRTSSGTESNPPLPEKRSAN